MKTSCLDNAEVEDRERRFTNHRCLNMVKQSNVAMLYKDINVWVSITNIKRHYDNTYNIDLFTTKRIMTIL